MDGVGSNTISEILFRLYGQPVEDDFFAHVLALLEGRLPTSVSGYSLTRLDTRATEKKMLRHLRGGSLPDLDRFNRSVQAQHPFLDHYFSNSGGPLLCTTDLMSEEEWQNTPFYREIYRPLGVVHEASVRFYEAESCFSFEFLLAEPLDQDARGLLRLVAPHLGNAYRLHQLQHGQLSGGLLDNLILLSDEGGVMDCSTALLERYFPGDGAAKRRLPQAIHQWIRKKISHNASNGWKAAQDTVAACGANSLRSLSLIRHAGGYALLLDAALPTQPVDALMGMGLTKREAEVLLWVAQGKQNSDVATVLDISTATVRKHVEHILQKLHCETRGAAAQMAMQAINDQRPNSIPTRCLTCTESECKSCGDLP